MAMEKRKPNEAADGEAAANPDGTPDQPQRRIDLPAVESPSISPVELGQATDTVVETTASEATEASASATGPENTSFSLAEFTAPKRWRFAIRPRHKRQVLLAASVAIAAAIGAITGALTSGGFAKAPAVDVAAVEENKAMQQSVARLTKEISGLKTSLDAANRSASNQIAKISERLNRETANVTGSVPPQTQTAPPAPLPATRPAMQPRLSIVPDWTIRETRDGLVYVQGHGDIYQVVPGAPLPGLGPVEQIRRQDGRWLVVTPKGIIVSMRDRRYFEQF
jgi:hypothetical protein